MGKTIAVLGGGWGGLTAAHALRGTLSSEHRIVVIEKRQSFIFYPSFIRVIIGKKQDLDHVESSLKNILRKDLEIINEEVINIDPITKTVTTNNQSISCDFIIIATGAELYPESIPGFEKHCLNLFDTDGAFKIHNKLKTINKGKIAFLITRTPFRCPPAPYEAAMLAGAFLKKRGIREKWRFQFTHPKNSPCHRQVLKWGKLLNKY